MGLEAVMVCLDNSEWGRNGDYAPTRFISQQDAANLLSDAKTSQNPETTVGVMAMAGRKPEILLTQSKDIGKLMVAIQQIQIGGYTDIMTSIKIAYLALKNRQNKAQTPKIIVFVCSPVLQDEKELVQLGKKMKKNKVSIDFVNFGIPENSVKLTAMINAVNQSNNSHLIDIQDSFVNITDALITSPIF
jgi:26S proteasome regulatory subunit N10